MQMKYAVDATKKIMGSMETRNHPETMKHIADLANIIQKTMENKGLWTTDELKKFNVIMKYILLAIEANDIEFGVNIIKNNLITLLVSIMLKEKENNDEIDVNVDEVTKEIKNQYTEFMYPNIWRGIVPADIHEKVKNPRAFGAVYNLEYMQHMAFEKFIPLKNIEVLIAGCGTGEDALMCAMAHPDAQFTFVDISPASLQMAKKYAEELDIKNVKLLQEDIMTMKLDRKFDMIISIGVIHHLTNPAEGVKNLKAHLKDWGVLSAMVYGEYGRFEIGLFQEAMKIISNENLDFAEGIEIVKRIFKEVEPENRMVNIAWKQDVLKGEQHIVDLLLNVNEHRYNVKSLQNMVKAGGMQLLKFVSKSTLNPDNYVESEALKKKFSKLDYIERCRLAELINGKLTKHNFYAIKSENHFKNLSMDDPQSLDYVPFVSPYLVQKSIKEFGEEKHYINLNPKALYDENVLDYGDTSVDKGVLGFINLCNGKNSINFILNQMKDTIDEEKMINFIKNAVEKNIIFLHR